MSADDVEVVRRWREIGIRDTEAASEVLASDVEWVVPVRGKTEMLRGIEAVRTWYLGDRQDEDEGGYENLDVSEERGELEDLRDGRVAAVNKLIYTWKESGEPAYEKHARIVYTVRDGKIVRYELENPAPV